MTSFSSKKERTILVLANRVGMEDPKVSISCTVTRKSAIEAALDHLLLLLEIMPRKAQQNSQCKQTAFLV